jgi:hypothetical protein
VTNLQAAVEIYLASLPADEWRALVCRVRPPSESTSPSEARNIETASPGLGRNPQ